MESVVIYANGRREYFHRRPFFLRIFKTLLNIARTGTLMLLAAPAFSATASFSGQVQEIKVRDVNGDLVSPAVEATGVAIATNTEAARAELQAIRIKTDQLQVSTTDGFSVLNVIPRRSVPIQRQQSDSGSYYAATTGIQTILGTTENAIFLFVNVATNSANAYIDNIRLTAASGNLFSAFRVYRNFQVTSSGTAVGIFPGKAGIVSASKMQGYVNPTVSLTGAQIVYSAFVTDGTNNFFLNQSRIFGPGTRFLVTVQNSSVNRDSAFEVEWSEE